MTTPLIAPYGSWKSPVTADLIVSGSVSLGTTAVSDDTVYWVEGRPTEGGRNVIVRRRADGSLRDVNPAPYNARSRVHEYGGGELAVDGDSVFFVNFRDQIIYRVDGENEPRPLTHTPGMRYADLVVDRRRDQIICVREDHTAAGEPRNTIVAIDLASGDETVLVSGHDFYSNPRVSNDGRLCWLAWDHPNMPWDGCELHVAELPGKAALGYARQVAGGKEESIFQPEWSEDGSLYFVSDRGGWWNLYRWRAGAVEHLAPREAEFGRPLWQFGSTTYAFLSPARLVCAYCERGTWRLALLEAEKGTLQPIDTPFTAIGSVRVAGRRVLFTAGSPVSAAALISLDPENGQYEVIKRSSSLEVDEGYLSRPEAIEFPTTNGLTAYGFFYRPRNRDYTAPAGEKPPLLVMSHGGPTSATSAVLSLRTQYWTSRGIAVLDVNYGGSSGYGREYRRRLDGAWGVVDVDDCCNGALYLARQGLVDGERLAITGGSAGGFTTLAALAFRDVFKAGASHFGVADLEALARDTHKFESRYLDRLVGPLPERHDLYLERSPIHHVERLSCPLVFFQGLEDEIVPPDQAERMVAALRAKGVPVAYLAFEGEQHGFRRAENIKRSIEGELYFYSRIFGFELAEAVEPLEIENLG